MLARRVGAVLAAVTAAGCLGLVQSPATAGVIAPPATITTVLPGGVGDDGPASSALVWSSAFARRATGQIDFYDLRSHQIREHDPATGTVRALLGLGYSTSVGQPSIPGDGADLRAVRIPVVSQMWATEDGDLWLVFAASSALYRVSGTTIRGWWTPPNDLTFIRTVAPDGRVLVWWSGQDPDTGTGPSVLQLRAFPASVTPPTTPPAALLHSRTGSVVGDDQGRLFTAWRGGIWRIDGIDDEVLVAGVDAVQPGPEAVRVEGAPALGAVMAPSVLAWAGGDRLVYSEAGSSGSGAATTRYRVVDLAGTVHTVAGPFGNTSADEPAACPASSTLMAATPTHLLTSCFESLRQWPLDGSASDVEGDLVVGSLAGSAVGGALDTAYVPGVAGLAARPGSGRAALVASSEVRVVSLDGSGGLGRVAGNGMVGDAVTDGEPATSGPLTFAGGVTYGPDGTLYVTTRAPSMADWKVRAVSTDGPISTLVGGGSEDIAAGVLGTSVDLSDWDVDAARLAPFGSVIAYGPVGGVLWGLDPATDRLSVLVGGGTGPVTDGSDAAGAALEVTGLASSGDPTQLYLEAAHAGTPAMYRVDAAGHVHSVQGPSTPSGRSVLQADGSVDTLGSGLAVRVSPEGRVTPLLGVDGVAGVTLGVPALGSLITSDGSGGDVLVDVSTLTPRVLRVTEVLPAVPTSASPITVSSSTSGLHFDLHDPSGGPAQQVRVSVRAGTAGRPWSEDWSDQYSDVVKPAGSSDLEFLVNREASGTPLQSGTTYAVTTWQWRPDGSAAATPVTSVLTYWDDGTPPSAAVSGPVTQTIRSTTVPVAWTGADDESGVQSFDVRYRLASGRYAFGAYSYPAALQGTSATSGSITGIPGKEYCFSVRARDRAGLVSAWSAPRCRVVPLDDRSLTVSSAVTRDVSSGAWLGTISRTRTAHERFVRTDFTANRVGVVATTCHGCGSVDVFLAGVRLGRISLESSSTHGQVPLWLPAGPTRHGTLVIETVSTAPVSLDGLISLR